MSSALDRLSKRASSSLTERVIEVPLEKVRFDPTQPRKAFHTIDGVVAEKDSAYIDELAESIRDKGLIQPVVMKELDDGSFVVVVGECRTRAHLKLGLPTIRAIVRNSLDDHNSRLLYQLAENVQRQNLSDDELALAIRELMKGNDDLKPMSQTQIAKALGKSEGWVSRFVKFGDEELHRLWVKSGIVDTVEKLYRLSILPKAVQVDVLRRVNLDMSDPDFLEKPILRELIDQLGRKFKIEKAAEKVRSQNSVESTSSPISAPSVNAPDSPVSFSPDVNDDVRALRDGRDAFDSSLVVGVNENVDPVGAAFAADVVSKYAEKSPADTPVGVVPSAPSSSAYQLPESARSEILGMSSSGAVGESGLASVGVTVQAPVRCRVSVSNVLALVSALSSADQQALLASVGDIQCDLNIPGHLAQSLANQFVGVIVDKSEVARNLQVELARLQ